MAGVRTRRISKYVLAGKPKGILQRVALKKKLRQNALANANKTSGQLFDSISQVNLASRHKKTKTQFLSSIAKKRNDHAKELRRPGVWQKMERAQLRTKAK